MLSVAVESKAFRMTRVEASVISECGGGGEKKEERVASHVLQRNHRFRSLLSF